uniref:TCTP domain-containing protein n=1 Tax=Arion vulgaris TaxID=1028688 RepID=A0A0B7ALP9_9EUPU
MKVYKCIITGDELFTDTYPMEIVSGLYKIKARYVTRSEKFDDSKLGANPSAEEETEAAEDASSSGVNVVLDNRLQKTGFSSKKEYMSYFKDFIKQVEEMKKAANPQLDVVAFRSGVQAAFKYVLASFDSYEYYTGESSNPDGNIALLKWETPEGESDDVPFVYFFVEGVKEEKC